MASGKRPPTPSDLRDLLADVAEDMGDERAAELAELLGPQPDPLAPDARWLEHLQRLAIVRRPEHEDDGTALRADREGKPLCRLVRVCDSHGRGWRARSARALTTSELGAVRQAYLFARELAHAQAILLSDLSTAEERDAATRYVGRLSAATALRTEENEGWFRIAATLDWFPEAEREALPALSQVASMLARRRLVGAGVDAAAVDRLTDAQLGRVLECWHKRGRGRNKAVAFAGLCEALGVEPPRDKNAAKQVRKRARSGSKKRGS